MKKVSELLKAIDHLAVFLKANEEKDEDERQIVEEKVEEIKNETPEEIKEEPVVVEPIKEETIEPMDDTTKPILEEKVEEVKEPIEEPKPLVIEPLKPFKPTDKMNYRELREYYKKLRDKK